MPWEVVGFSLPCHSPPVPWHFLEGPDVPLPTGLMQRGVHMGMHVQKAVVVDSNLEQRRRSPVNTCRRALWITNEWTSFSQKQLYFSASLGHSNKTGTHKKDTDVGLKENASAKW